MKKLFIIIPCLLLMFLFIVLNYLLWDRQNKAVIDSSKDATISALGREIKNMETVDGMTRERLDKVEADYKTLKDKSDELTNDKSKLQATLTNKNDIIEQLKQTADLSAPQAAVKNWLDNLSKGQYENAYQLQTATAFGSQMSQDDFVKLMKSKIKSLKVTSDKTVLQPPLADRPGDIIFKVGVEVARIPDSGKFVFEDGKTERQFTVIFNKEKNTWLVSLVE